MRSLEEKEEKTFEEIPEIPLGEVMIPARILL